MDSDALKDEELLLLSRLGVAGALETLTSRYYAKREYHAKRAAPASYFYLNAFDLGSEFFNSFLHAVNSFRFGNSRFRRYFESALGHDIARKVGEVFEESKNIYLSDCALKSDGEDTNVTFCDVIPSSGYDDPRIFLNYADEAIALGKAPKELNRSVLLVASLRLKGKSYAEIMELTGLSYKVVKTRFKAFRDFVTASVLSGEYPVKA